MINSVKFFAVAGITALLLGSIGCGHSSEPQPIDPQTFYNPKPLGAAPATAPSNTAAITEPSKPAMAAPVAVASISDSAAIPATRPVLGIPSGKYQTVGGVVAEVNGNPIFANKVLYELRSELAIKAREMTEAQFLLFATQEITKRIVGFERDELVFAAAQRQLEEDDKNLAENLTMQWRLRQVTEAGGSIELVRQRALADGYDFDELVRDQYRKYMTEVYYRKKVVPRIQISADDIRQYYQMNLDKEFTEHDEVKFRLIKIDPRKRSNGREGALDQIKQLCARAKAGEDFAAMAGAVNDDPRLMRTSGEEGAIQRGAFRLEKVEQALWKTEPGRVTDIIEEGGAFYIAKVESRRLGRVMPFEEQAVQNKIHSTLWAQQFRMMTEQIEANLRKGAMVRDSQEMFDIAIQMAMQNYPQWSAKN